MDGVLTADPSGQSLHSYIGGSRNIACTYITWRLPEGEPGGGPPQLAGPSPGHCLLTRITGGLEGGLNQGISLGLANAAPPKGPAQVAGSPLGGGPMGSGVQTGFPSRVAYPPFRSHSRGTTAQLAERPTLDFSSTHDPRGVGLSPVLCRAPFEHGACLGFILTLSLSLSLSSHPPGSCIL